MIDFSSLILALLGVMAGLAGLVVVTHGGELILAKLKGSKVAYGGRMWDEDVYRSALNDLEKRRRRGEILDRDSYAALRSWKRGK